MNVKGFIIIWKIYWYVYAQGFDENKATFVEELRQKIPPEIGPHVDIAYFPQMGFLISLPNFIKSNIAEILGLGFMVLLLCLYLHR